MTRLASLTLLVLLTAPSVPFARPAPFQDWHAEAAAAHALSLPTLTDADVAPWGAWIRPSAEELAFEEIPWIASFAEGLRAAERAGKPLLFWAMNGHPLGCT
jgi:hypothetical protein